MSINVKNICGDINISGKTTMDNTKFGLCYSIAYYTIIVYNYVF